MKTSDFNYVLPKEFIAQTPVEPRDSSRLMVYNRKTGEIIHTIFRKLPDFLSAGDLLVLNQTRVIPARLFGKKIPTGGKVEVLLLKKLGECTWETIVGGKRLFPNKEINFDDQITGKITEMLDGKRRIIRFSHPIENYLDSHGIMPLPPYIHVPLHDPERYQTIYAQEKGSAAAPTAGLHFTESLFQELRNKSIQSVNVTLHVGLDTFEPVNEEDPRDHKIHTEWCKLDAPTSLMINQAIDNGHRVVAVGTTSVRVIETAADSKKKKVHSFEGPTSLYILPEYKFNIVDALITNFHLPKSTLLMLVSAFVGRETILRLYEIAMNKGYRFYSFGDAMLIL